MTTKEEHPRLCIDYVDYTLYGVGYYECNYIVHLVSGPENLGIVNLNKSLDLQFRDFRVQKQDGLMKKTVRCTGEW